MSFSLYEACIMESITNAKLPFSGLLISYSGIGHLSDACIFLTVIRSVIVGVDISFIGSTNTNLSAYLSWHCVKLILRFSGGALVGLRRGFGDSEFGFCCLGYPGTIFCITLPNLSLTSITGSLAILASSSFLFLSSKYILVDLSLILALSF